MMDYLYPPFHSSLHLPLGRLLLPSFLPPRSQVVCPAHTPLDNHLKPAHHVARHRETFLDGLVHLASDEAEFTRPGGGPGATGLVGSRVFDGNNKSRTELVDIANPVCSIRYTEAVISHFVSCLTGYTPAHRGVKLRAPQSVPNPKHDFATGTGVWNEHRC